MLLLFAAVLLAISGIAAVADHDTNGDRKIDKIELIAAMNLYLFEDALTKAEVIDIINHYLFDIELEPPAATIAVTLSSPATQGKSVRPRVEPNHRIGEVSLQFWVKARDEWHGKVSLSTIAAGEGGYLWAILDVHWEDVTAVRLRTLAGATIRTWECEREVDRHAVEGKYACTVGETRQAPSLSDAEDAALWVYLSGGDVHVRVGDAPLGDVRVYFRYGGDYADEYGRYGGVACNPTGRPLNAGVTQTLACYRPGKSSAQVNWVAASSPAAGAPALRCERHEDSDASRSIWACDPW